MESAREYGNDAYNITSNIKQEECSGPENKEKVENIIWIKSEDRTNFVKSEVPDSLFKNEDVETAYVKPEKVEENEDSITSEAMKIDVSDSSITKVEIEAESYFNEFNSLTPSEDSHMGLKPVNGSNESKKGKQTHSRIQKSARGERLNASEVYSSKYKLNVNSHIISHKKKSVVTLFKCELCTFETKYKRSFLLHELRHKSTTEMAMYKCDLCSYMGKQNSLKTHMLVHKNFPDLPLYKCELCVYMSKYKWNINKHMLCHKNNSQVIQYKCDICPFQSKHKESLRKHMLRHRGPSEITMYKCKHCPYESRYKGDLKTHMLRHKSVSEVTMYKCNVCLYESKFKSYLRRHVLRHKNSSEVVMQ